MAHNNNNNPIWSSVNLSGSITDLLQQMNPLVARDGNITPQNDLAEALATLKFIKTTLTPLMNDENYLVDPAAQICLNGLVATLQETESFCHHQILTKANDMTVEMWRDKRIYLYQLDFLLKQQIDQYQSLFLNPQDAALLIDDAEGQQLWSTAFGPQITMVGWGVFWKLLVTQLGDRLLSEEANVKQFIDFTRNDYVSAFEFSVFLKWFGPLSECFTRLMEAVHGGLICGFVPALEAKMLLEGKRNGTFLIRMSKTHAGSFAVTFVDSRGSVKHCIKEGTPVALSDGTTLPIEAIERHSDVIAWSPQSEEEEEEEQEEQEEEEDKFKVRGRLALCGPRVAATLNQGLRECVTVCLEDGRQLIVTPDHELLTLSSRANQQPQYLRADQLTSQHRVICAAIANSSQCNIDERVCWQSNGQLKSVADDDDDDDDDDESEFAWFAQHRLGARRALALARIAGTLLDLTLVPHNAGAVVPLARDDAAVFFDDVAKVLVETRRRRRSTPFVRICDQGVLLSHCAINQLQTLLGNQTTNNNTSVLLSNIPVAMRGKSVPRAVVKEFVATLSGRVIECCKACVTKRKQLKLTKKQKTMILGAVQSLMECENEAVRWTNHWLTINDTKQFIKMIGIRHNACVSEELAVIAAHSGLKKKETFKQFKKRALISSHALALRVTQTPQLFANGQLQQVYDLSVPKYTSFVANGIVAHNCLLYSVIGGVTLRNPPTLFASLKEFASAHQSKLKFPRMAVWSQLMVDARRRAYDEIAESPAPLPGFGSAPGQQQQPQPTQQPSMSSTGQSELCLICWENPVTTVFLECKHMACCSSCADQLDPKICPYCRAPIVRVIEVFKP